jgi:hypothetical protein
MYIYSTGQTPGAAQATPTFQRRALHPEQGHEDRLKNEELLYRQVLPQICIVRNALIF